MIAGILTKVLRPLNSGANARSKAQRGSAIIYTPLADDRHATGASLHTAETPTNEQTIHPPTHPCILSPPSPPSMRGNLCDAKTSEKNPPMILCASYTMYFMYVCGQPAPARLGSFPSSAHTFLSDICPTSCTVAARERLTANTLGSMPGQVVEAAPLSV